MQSSENGANNEVADYGTTVLTGSELAAVLGLSEAHIFTLKRRNVIQSIGPRKNEYRLGESVRAYVAYKCATDSESQADFHRERALKEKANRELREILLKQTREQLHRACDVKAIGADSNADIRSKVSKFGKLLSSQITGKTDPAQVKDVIDIEVRKVLNKLREFNPRDYYRRSKSVQLKALQSPQPEKEEREKETFGQPGWPRGKPRGSSPHPWASAANKKRWATDPEALARTVRAMNDAKLAAKGEVHAKLSQAARKRWQSKSLEERAKHAAKMRAARKSVSGAGP
jgi:hypothetical protein